MKIIGEDEASTPEGPQPAEPPLKPGAVDPNAGDWELLPPPDSNAIDGRDTKTLPPGDKPTRVGSPPLGEQEPRSNEEGTELPPETKGEPAPNSDDEPPEPPIPHDTTLKKGEATLRFVSFSAVAAITPRRVDRTSDAVKDAANQSDHIARRPGADRSENPASHPAKEAAPCDDPQGMLILEALRMSFSPPAPRQPPTEGGSVSP